jgi:hypothetical protein
MSYKVLAVDKIGVRCKESVANLPEVSDRDPQNPKTKVGDAIITTVSSPYVTIRANVRLAGGANANWLSVELISGNKLQSATKYSVAITLAPSALGQPETSIPAISIDTTSSYTVNPAKSASDPILFSFRSATVALSNPAGKCTLMVTTLLARSHQVPVRGCVLRDQILPDDWDEIGIVNVTLESSPVLQMLPDSLTGPIDVFAMTPTIPKTARMSPLKPPASKDVATWYFNLTFLGASGSSPAWTLDGKVVPRLVPGLYGGFEINPFVGSANVGQGSISTAKYTDTIDLGSNAIRTFEPQRNGIDSWVLTPGITAESDKEFDTWNMLGTIDAKFNLRGSYNPELRQQLESLAALIRSDPTRSWTINDVAIPRFGYLFDVHTMLETGKKVSDSTVQNSNKSASLTLPEYSILRPAVQLHGLLQLYRVSADCVMTGRYLALTEDSVLEHKDKSLYLYKFHGWKAYNMVTGAYQIDPIGHWALSITYNNGFAPPKYSRANSVQVGLLVKY